MLTVDMVSSGKVAFKGSCIWSRHRRRTLGHGLFRGEDRIDGGVGKRDNVALTQQTAI